MQKRRKAQVACMQCKRAHLSCSDQRPCERCVAKHIPHLCDDASFRPVPQPFTNEEMQTMAKILGPEFDFLTGTAEYDLLQASNTLDYASVFFSDTETYLHHKISKPDNVIEPTPQPQTVDIGTPQFTQESTPFPPIYNGQPETQEIEGQPQTPLQQLQQQLQQSLQQQIQQQTQQLQHQLLQQAQQLQQTQLQQTQQTQPQNGSPGAPISPGTVPTTPELANGTGNGTMHGSAGTVPTNPSTNGVIPGLEGARIGPHGITIPPPTRIVLTGVDSNGVTVGRNATNGGPGLFSNGAQTNPNSITVKGVDASVGYRNVAVVHTYPNQNNPLTSKPSEPTTPHVVTVGPSTNTVRTVYTSNNKDNSQLQAQLESLTAMNAKLQAALADRDRQLLEIQALQKAEHTKLHILARCKIIPQGLDLTLVTKSKTYGLMTGLFDIKTGYLLDYNKNFAKLLRDIYGPNYDDKLIQWLPGPGKMEDAMKLLQMLVEDNFRESLEKYTYIELPSGEKLPFLMSVSIQCWERPEGPVVNCTYWI